MAERPLVSAIVVSFNTRELTLRSVASVFDHLPAGSEVIVVDNASEDGSADAVRERFPRAQVIKLTENVGFGRANNVGLGRAEGAFILLLNSDARLVDGDAVARMVARMDDEPAVGVVGPRLESPSGRLEFSARSFPTLGREIVRRFGLYLLLPRETVGRRLLGDFWSPPAPMRVDWITGACMLVRREAYESVGGFDPRIFMYGEEQEWCWRITRAGWQIVYDPEITVVHDRAASGALGSWRVRAALGSEVRTFRWAHGAAMAALFNLVRVTGMLVEGVAVEVVGRLRPSPYLEQRRRRAWTELREQLHVVLRHPIG